ncbi:MAG: FAD-binding oxidoreductase [Solirubrobacteraceae bacterium]
MPAMKWWGWGEAGASFTHEDKPQLAPFIERALGLRVGPPTAGPPRLEELTIPAPALGDRLRGALEQGVGSSSVSSDDHDRVVHARGKSLRDLIMQRRGEFPRLPDVVVRPADEAAVAAVVRAAVEHDAVVIPFGGGSSISGSLEAPSEERRPVISLDLGRLDRLLGIDDASRLARVQAGVFGPSLERQLAARGWTLGHYPDSFPHSTLGGWIATRSSGMQSDRYGDICDIARGMRVLTPSGTLIVRPVPAASNGPSVREMVLGSEGRLGVITEATVQVRRVPEQRLILGYLFGEFAAGVAAMRELAESECSVSVTRVSDAHETQFSFATRRNPTLVDHAQSRALRAYLTRLRAFDTERMALSFIGFEGSHRHVSAQRHAVGAIVKRYGGICLGAGPGKLYDQKKFDTPYIRDFLLDRGVAGDVSETATVWSGLMPLYDAVMAAGHEAFEQAGVRGYLMCHLSHSYHAGACLYFTFALLPPPGTDMLAAYTTVKSAIQQSFVDNGATLSHHHAVGTEHAPWLEQDISPPGVAMLRGLFDGIDPHRHMNPGKIV